VSIKFPTESGRSIKSERNPSSDESRRDESSADMAQLLIPILVAYDDGQQIGALTARAKSLQLHR